MNGLLRSKEEAFLGMLPDFFDNYLPELPITNRERLLQKAEASLFKKGNLSTYVTLLNELPELDGVEISETGRINFELSLSY